MKKPLVLIEWVDAHSECSWADKDEVVKYSKGRSVVFEVGWIIAQNKDSIVIVSQYCEDGDMGNRTRIPKKWIIKQRRIKC